MSEIAGSTVMLVAAEYLSRSNEGKGVILGGITGVPPSQVVILARAPWPSTPPAPPRASGLR